MQSGVVFVYMRKIGFLAVILSMLMVNFSYAHPGRTDRKGGHTCRTNCPKWGLRYGQYHFHWKR